MLEGRDKNESHTRNVVHLDLVLQARVGIDTAADVSNANAQCGATESRSTRT